VKTEFLKKRTDVALSALRVDHRYQRATRKRRVAMIAANFDPDAFGVIHVVLRKDGTFWIIDGQHRVEAVRSLGESWKNTSVPALVYSDLSLKDEAWLFMHLNDAVSVHPFDKFKAARESGDPTACAIANISEGAGFPINGKKTDCITCVVALRKVYGGMKWTGPATLRKTLDVLAKAWGTEKPYPSGEIVVGLGMFLGRYGQGLDTDRLVHQLAQVPSGGYGLVGKARTLNGSLRGAMSVAVFECLRREYNKGLRTNKLESWIKED